MPSVVKSSLAADAYIQPPVKKPPTGPPRTFEGPPANLVLWDQEHGIEAGDIVSPAETSGEGDDDLPTVPLTYNEADRDF